MSNPLPSDAPIRGSLFTRIPGILQALLALAFLYPVIVCVALFPTPAADLREHINLGLTLPLYTHTNPPLQTWLVGALALLGAYDAWFFVLVAQVLNFIGLAYLAAAARKFIGPQAVLPLIIILCGSAYYSVATPTMALNADQLAMPIWAAFIYHALLAARDDRWRDWLLCGILFGIAFLTKYYAVVMASAFLVAALCEPTQRRIFANDRFHTAILVSLPIIAINVVPEWLRRNAIWHGVLRFDLFDPSAQGASWLHFLSIRAAALGHFARSFLLYGLPAVIGLAVLAWRRQISRPRMPRDPTQRLIIFAALAIVAAMLLLILIAGLRYSTRYAYPFYGLCVLALLSAVEITPSAVDGFAKIVLACWALTLAGTLVYASVVINRVLREPAPVAAAALRAEWDRRYTCGPAYILGDKRTARAIAAYYRHGVFGIGFDDVDQRDWFDPKEVERLGAIIISTPELADSIYQKWFAGRTAATMALPYRRTWRTDQHTYVYMMTPPQSCSTGFARLR